MLEFFMSVLTIVALLAFVVVIIKAGKVPKMPAFYERIVRCGIFNRLAFKNDNFKRTVREGRTLPEIKIEKLCGLCNGAKKGD